MVKGTSRRPAATRLTVARQAADGDVAPGRAAPATKALNLRLPADLHEQLRRVAYERRQSINAVIVEAVEAAVRAAG